MIKVYSVIDESETHTTYQYNTACSWWVYGSLAILLLGMVTELSWFTVIAMVSFLIYLAIVYFPALAVARMLKTSMKANSIQLSGSRWSFSKPLQARVPKVLTDRESDPNNSVS